MHMFLLSSILHKFLYSSYPCGLECRSKSFSVAQNTKFGDSHHTEFERNWFEHISTKDFFFIICKPANIPTGSIILTQSAKIRLFSLNWDNTIPNSILINWELCKKKKKKKKKAFAFCWPYDPHAKSRPMKVVQYHSDQWCLLAWQLWQKVFKNFVWCKNCCHARQPVGWMASQTIMTGHKDQYVIHRDQIVNKVEIQELFF